MANRPLSPHISVYRFAYTMALSILHRGTGLLLTAGLVLLVVFLASVAKGATSYDAFRTFASGIAGRLLIAAFLIGFCYHLANGIRHLLWDLGLGMERVQARRSGAVVVALTVLGAAVVLWSLFGFGMWA
jgi:succinate dehydrogenase / fumarate reductase cytochrome b subunit